jgi:very-short-patch-repair endonuclease
MNYDKILTKDFLIKEYVVNEKSIRELGNEFGISTYYIKKYLKIYNITIRDSGLYRYKICKKEREKISKELLVSEYVDKIKSFKEVGKAIGRSSTFVRLLLIHYNIPIRKRWELAYKRKYPKGCEHPSYGIKRPEHSVRMMGNGNPLFGKKRPKKTRNKISKTRIKRFESGELVVPQLGIKKPDWSEKMKINWQNKEFRYKMITASMKAQKKSMNLCEKLLAKHLPKNFKYVGNGKVIIGGFCPDFVDSSKKLIIEHFGDYWHNLPTWKERDCRRFKEYKNAGYRTLVIWEHELKNINNVKNKVNNFVGATYVK